MWQIASLYILSKETISIYAPNVLRNEIPMLNAIKKLPITILLMQ